MTQPARIGLSVSLLLGLLLVLQLRSAGEAVPIRKPLDGFPGVVGEWRARESEVLDLSILDKLKTRDYLMRRDQEPGGRSVWLFIGYWDSQRAGAQPHSPKNCLPGHGWEPLEASRVIIPLSPPFTPITVNRYVIQKDRDRMVVFYWYQSQGKAVAGELAAKVEAAKNSIFRRRTDGALVRVSSPIYQNVRVTSDLLATYVRALYPVLGDYLPD
jgi:EpsI family protein